MCNVHSKQGSERDSRNTTHASRRAYQRWATYYVTSPPIWPLGWGTVHLGRTICVRSAPNMTEASQQANQKSQSFPSANEPPRSRKLGVNKPAGSALDGAASSERNRNCCGLANQHIIAASDLRSLYTNQHASAAAKTCWLYQLC